MVAATGSVPDTPDFGGNAVTIRNGLGLEFLIHTDHAEGLPCVPSSLPGNVVLPVLGRSATCAEQRLYRALFFFLPWCWEGTQDFVHAGQMLNP